MDATHTDADDGWVEQALRADACEDASAYVADDGFTAAVMARLPAPVALPAWRRPVVLLLGVIAGCALAALLPDMFYAVFRDLAALVVGQSLSWSNVALALLLLGATTWSTLVYAMRAE
jgi:hypothetical protein